jgi:transposase-like protein
LIEKGTIKEVAHAIGMSPHTLYSWRRIKFLEMTEDGQVEVAHALKVKAFMKKWKRSNNQKGKMPALFRGGINTYSESVLRKIKQDLKPL